MLGLFNQATLGPGPLWPPWWPWFLASQLLSCPCPVAHLAGQSTRLCKQSSESISSLLLGVHGIFMQLFTLEHQLLSSCLLCGPCKLILSLASTEPLEIAPAGSLYTKQKHKTMQNNQIIIKNNNKETTTKKTRNNQK